MAIEQGGVRVDGAVLPRGKLTILSLLISNLKKRRELKPKLEAFTESPVSTAGIAGRPGG